MSDDVGARFEELGRVPVPPGDLRWVMREGRVRRRRRAAVRIASLSVVALAAGVATLILSGQEQRPVPATPDDRGLLESRLVPLIMDGPVPGPGPELAPEEERERARAVTVAFHALLDRAPSYDFDYRDVERSAGGWIVEFRDLSERAELEQALSQRRNEVTSREMQIEARRSELVEAVNELSARLREGGGGDRRRFERMHDELRGAARDAREQVRQVEEQLADIEERLSDLRRRSPGLPVTLTVAERDGLVVVEDLTAESESSAALRDVAGYAEPVEQIDAWGADYYGVEIRRVDERLVRVNVRRFWTGPLAAPYEERCVPEVVDRTGTVVWPGLIPRTDYASAPPTEGLRDREQVELGFEYRGDERDLSVSIRCLWRPRR